MLKFKLYDILLSVFIPIIIYIVFVPRGYEYNLNWDGPIIDFLIFVMLYAFYIFYSFFKLMPFVNIVIGSIASAIFMAFYGNLIINHVYIDIIILTLISVGVIILFLRDNVNDSNPLYYILLFMSSVAFFYAKENIKIFPGNFNIDYYSAFFILSVGLLFLSFGGVAPLMRNFLIKK
jgi:hypothetical protein